MDSSSKSLPDNFKKLSILTWEEQQNLTHKYSADLTPEERLAYLKELNDRTFGVKGDEPVSDKKINFD